MSDEAAAGQDLSEKIPGRPGLPSVPGQSPVRFFDRCGSSVGGGSVPRRDRPDGRRIAGQGRLLSRTGPDRSRDGAPTAFMNPISLIGWIRLIGSYGLVLPWKIEVSISRKGRGTSSAVASGGMTSLPWVDRPRPVGRRRRRPSRPGASPLRYDLRAGRRAGQEFPKNPGMFRTGPARAGDRQAEPPPTNRPDREDPLWEGLCPPTGSDRSPDRVRPGASTDSDRRTGRPLGGGSVRRPVRPSVSPNRVGSGGWSPLLRDRSADRRTRPVGGRGARLLRTERAGGEHEVLQQRLGQVDGQAPDGHQCLDGHVMGRLVGQVAPQPLEGAVAIAPRLINPAQVMVGQGQQQTIDGRRIGPRRGPGSDGGGRGPVADQEVGRREPRQAIPLLVGLDPPQDRF